MMIRRVLDCTILGHLHVGGVDGDGDEDADENEDEKSEPIS